MARTRGGQSVDTTAAISSLYNGSRSGPACGLTREELAGLREEARLAEYSGLLCRSLLSTGGVYTADICRIAVCMPLNFVE